MAIGNPKINIGGNAKEFVSSADDAAKACARLEREANKRAREIEQYFKQVTIAIAKIGAVVIVAKKAFELYSTVMNSTEGSAEKLEKQIAYLDGGVTGLYRNIISNNPWYNLIEDIKKTAEATRDAKDAMQELEHAMAGSTIKRGRLQIGLQEARVSAAEAGTPGEKKTYYEEAISYQRQLTELNVSEIAKRLKIDEDYYRKVTGNSKEYFDYFLKQVPMMAQEYEYFFGKESVVLEGSRKRLSDLAAAQTGQVGGLTAAQEKERHQLQLLVYVLEDYIKIQDDFSKKGQWDNYIKGIGEMGTTAAEGAKMLVRLTTQMEKQERAINKLDKPVKELKKSYQDLPKIFQFPEDINTKQLTPMPQYEYDTSHIEKVSSEMERMKPVVEGLQKAFEGFFQNMGEGFDKMAKSFIAAVEQMAAEAAAKALIFLIVDLFSGGMGAASILGKSFTKYVTGFAGGTNFAPGGLSIVGEKGPELVNLPRGSKVIPNNQIGRQNITINLKGKFDGRDIYYAVQNYATILDQNT